MKKSLLGAAALFLAVGLFTGCGSKEEPQIPLNQMDVEQYVTLGDYYNLGLTVEIESQIKMMMAEVYHRNMTVADGITDRPVELGDGVDIDYEGKKDGVAFVGGTAQGAFLSIGSGQFIDGFEDGLVGVMPGETVVLDLTFPTYYGNADLAGQAVVFTVTVNYIVPDEEGMKDSVVAALGVEEVSTVAALREDVFDYLYYNSSEMEMAQNDVLMALVECSTYTELPQDMVDDNKSRMLTFLEYWASHYGVSTEQYASTFYAMTPDEFVQTFAERGVRENLALQAVANKEGLNVSDEELAEELELAAAANEYDSVEKFLEGYNYTREQYRNLIMADNVLKFLLHLQDTI